MGIRNKEQLPRGITVPLLRGNGGTICEMLGENFEGLSLEHKFEVLKLEMQLMEAKQRVEDGDCRDEHAFFRTEALWAIVLRMR